MTSGFKSDKTCVHCKCLLVKTYFRCPGTNHAICHFCHQRYYRCPNCNAESKKRTKTSSPDARNPGIEFYCKNRPFGCTVRLPIGQHQQHETTCTFVSFRCPCHCTEVASLWSIHAHLPISNFDPKNWSNSWTYTVCKGDWKRTVLVSAEHVYLLEIKVIGRNANSLILNAICLFLTNSEEALEFDASSDCDAEMKWNKKSATKKLKLPVSCVLDNREDYTESFFKCCTDSIFKFTVSSSKNSLTNILQSLEKFSFFLKCR